MPAVGYRSVLTTDLGPGDALFLYTDGLVERRRGDNEAMLTRLVATMPRRVRRPTSTSGWPASSRRSVTPPVTTMSRPSCSPGSPEAYVGAGPVRVTR